MPHMNYRIETPPGDLKDMTAMQGPIFLMDYFFNQKGGKPYHVEILDSAGGSEFTLSPGSYGARSWPLVVFGQPVSEISIGAYAATEPLREHNNLLIPGDGSKPEDYIWMRFRAASASVVNDDVKVQFPIEIWEFTYGIDETGGSSGWLFEPDMAEPHRSLTYDKRTGRVFVL